MPPPPNPSPKPLVAAQCFGEADYISKFFEGEPIDGILGLAFKDIAVGHVPPVFDVMVAEQVVASAKFSVYLNSDQGADSSAIVFGPSSSLLCVAFWLAILAIVGAGVALTIPTGFVLPVNCLPPPPFLFLTYPLCLSPLCI